MSSRNHLPKYEYPTHSSSLSNAPNKQQVSPGLFPKQRARKVPRTFWHKLVRVHLGADLSQTKTRVGTRGKAKNDLRLCFRQQASGQHSFSHRLPNCPARLGLGLAASWISSVYLARDNGAHCNICPLPMLTFIRPRLQR